MDYFWNYAVPILFISGAIVVLDYYFIGYISALIGDHKWCTDKDIILYSVNAGKIRSSCFSPHKKIEEVRGYFTQVDSNVAISNTHIYIGKKVLSSHYVIPMRDVVDAEGMVKNKFIYTIIFQMQTIDGDCFVEIDGFAFTEADRNKCRKLISFVKLNMKHSI